MPKSWLETSSRPTWMQRRNVLQKRNSRLRENGRRSSRNRSNAVKHCSRRRARGSASPQSHFGTLFRARSSFSALSHWRRRRTATDHRLGGFRNSTAAPMPMRAGRRLSTHCVLHASRIRSWRIGVVRRRFGQWSLRMPASSPRRQSISISSNGSRSGCWRGFARRVISTTIFPAPVSRKPRILCRA